MTFRSLRKPAFATLLLILLANPSDLSSCGPFFPVAIFTRTTIPDNEMQFFQGKLGILHPTLWRAYLAMAYRTLNGMPLSKEQAESVRQQREPITDAPAKDALHGWLEERMKVPDAKPVEIERYRTGPDYQSFLGCGDDAFLTAAKTLDSLLRAPGGEAEDWLTAQDAVFSNCGKQGTMPEPAPSGSSDRVRANRAYQIASAHFYSNDWDEAKAQFEQIAADRSSPWHTIAPYLAARVDLRRESYGSAIIELEAILADPKLSAIYPQTRDLLDYAQARSNPAAYMASCARRIVEPHPADLAHALHDYTFLYDRFEDSSADKNGRYRPDDLKELTAKDELTAWIANFGTESAVTHWKQNGSLPWLVSALSYTAVSPDSGALVNAALQIPSTSPAYVDVRFQVVRILTETKKEDQARTALAGIEPHLQDFSLSTQNAFRAEHMKLARNFDEFLSYAPRTLTARTYGDELPGETPDTPNSPPLSFLDEDSTLIFNNDLPLRFWLGAARDAKLSPILRVQIAQAGFVRACLIGHSISTEFARELRVLKPPYADALDVYLHAPQQEREFSIAFWMLQHPELIYWLRPGFQRETQDAHIDDFRDNWWCGQGTPIWHSGQPASGETNTPAPSFLTETEVTQGRSESAALNKAGSAPTYLSSVVVAWARSHPGDPRLPEALALAVKTSRFGCTDTESAKPVSEAFGILHRRFPNTDWAKRTPFWYK